MTRTSPNAVLVLGNKPSVCFERIRQLSFVLKTTKVYLLCRDASNLSSPARQFFEAVMVGDETNPKDIERALLTSKARLVILPMSENSHIAAGTRDPTREALAHVMQTNPGLDRLQVLAISKTSTAVISYEKQPTRAAPTRQRAKHETKPNSTVACAVQKPRESLKRVNSEENEKRTRLFSI